MVSAVFQVVNVSRLEGDDNPVQLIYFVEDQDGERLSAVKSSDLINKMDLQRAAIILGYRIQGAIAQRKCLRCCRLCCAVLGSKARLILTVSSECKAFRCVYNPDGEVPVVKIHSPRPSLFGFQLLVGLASTAVFST